VTSRYEHGNITPSIEAVAKIVDALEFSIDYLIGKTKMALNGDIMRTMEETILIQ